MRFMVFMIPKVYQPKNGKNPAPKLTAANAQMMVKMGRFNERLKKTGALLSLNGLQPLASGARLSYSSGKVSVTDGPRARVKEVVGGYWLLKANSLRQVIAWMKRCPAATGDVIEIRQIATMADFPADLRAALRRG